MPTSYKRRVGKEGRRIAEVGGILLGVGIVVIIFWIMVKDTEGFLKGVNPNLISWSILGVILCLLSGILLFLGYYLKDHYEKEYFVLLRSSGTILVVMTIGGVATYLGFDNRERIDIFMLMLFLITLIVSYSLIASGTFLICRETFKEEVERESPEEELE